MKELGKVHSDEQSCVGNCLGFQKITRNLFLTETYFKIQSKLTNFIKQIFLKQQIGGLLSWKIEHPWSCNAQLYLLQV